MSKAIIVTNEGDALYTARIEYDYTQAENRRLALQQKLIDLVQPILNVELELVALKNEREAFADQMDSSLRQAQINQTPPSADEVKAFVKQIAEINTRVITSEAVLVSLKLQRASAASEKTAIENHIQGLSTTEFLVYCADYTHDLPVGAEVYLVLVPGELTGATLNIGPAYEATDSGNPGKAAHWTREIRGQMTPPWAMSPEAVFYNWAILPGWQRWRPIYRHGTITAIYDGLADVTLHEARSSVRRYFGGANVTKGLNVNRDNGITYLTQVPAVYMTCHMAAFEVGDEVIVQVDQNENWTNPTIIGFKGQPKPCATSAFVLFPSSDTHPKGIPQSARLERILFPQWFVRDPVTHEGGGNIDWLGKQGDVLTFWGAGSRYLGNAFTSSTSAHGVPGLVWSVDSAPGIKTNLGKGFTQDYLPGGLWHNGVAVQYNGSSLLSARPRGACLTQKGDTWYLHYVLHESGNYNVYRAEFDRDRHTVTRPPAVIATKVSGGSSSSRPFFFNASGTKGVGIGSQLEDEEYVARKWTIIITGTGGAIEVGDPVSESVIDETYDRSGSLTDGVTLTHTRRVVFNAWLGADFNGDREINITLQKTYNNTITTNCAGIPVGEGDLFPGHGEVSLGSHTETETHDAVLSWDGPYPGSVQLKRLVTDQSLSNITFIFDHQGAPLEHYGLFYPDGYHPFDGHNNELGGEQSLGETGSDVTSIERRRIAYLDVRYGTVLYRKTKTNYNYTTSVEQVGEGNSYRRIYSAFSYTPFLTTVLETYGSERKRETWNGETVNNAGGAGTYTISLPFPLLTTNESYANHNTHRHDQTGFNTLNISYWQGTVQATPDYTIISHPLQWAGIGDDETLFNALYRAGGGLELSDPQMQAVVGIEGDNEGYAPMRIYSASQ